MKFSSQNWRQSFANGDGGDNPNFRTGVMRLLTFHLPEFSTSNLIQDRCPRFRFENDGKSTQKEMSWCAALRQVALRPCENGQAISATESHLWTWRRCPLTRSAMYSPIWPVSGLVSQMETTETPTSYETVLVWKSVSVTFPPLNMEQVFEIRMVNRPFIAARNEKEAVRIFVSDRNARLAFSGKPTGTLTGHRERNLLKRLIHFLFLETTEKASSTLPKRR